MEATLENYFDNVEQIVRIVNTILMYAIKDGASEVEIEPREHGITVFFHVNNERREQMKMPTYVLEPLVARFKTMAQLDVNNHQPQRGHTLLKMEINYYDVAVQTAPSKFGEKVTLQIAPRPQD